MAKKSSGALTLGLIAGWCAFVALVLTGINWLLIKLLESPIDLLAQVSGILLVATAFIAAWGYVCTFPKKSRLIWQIVVGTITVLALLGYIGL